MRRTPSLGPHHLSGGRGVIRCPLPAFTLLFVLLTKTDTREGQNLSPALLIPSVSLLSGPTGLGVELLLFRVTFHVDALIHFVSMASLNT